MAGQHSGVAAPPSRQSTEHQLSQPPPANNAFANLSPNERQQRLDHVLQSDIGILTLITRLKQSVSSTRDYAGFLKERALLEERQAQGLKKLSRSTHELLRRPENRQGSYAQNLEELCRIHDRMADHGLQFVASCSSMYEELQDLAATTDRGRKHWKAAGLAAEKRVQDSESAMEKAKLRYNNLVEQYDRVRTGERRAGGIHLKPKSAAQQEEELYRKVELADQDYQGKVQAAQVQRQELTDSLRPQAQKAIQDMITECDAGLSMQLAKYAMINEKLLLGNGLVVSPMKSSNTSSGKSLREVAQGIDQNRDFEDFVLGFSDRVPNTPQNTYEQHPVMTQSKQQQPFSATPAPYGQPEQNTDYGGVTSTSYGQQGDRNNADYGGYDQSQQPPGSGQQTGVAPSYGQSSQQSVGPQSQGQKYDGYNNSQAPMRGVTSTPDPVNRFNMIPPMNNTDHQHSTPNQQNPGPPTGPAQGTGPQSNVNRRRSSTNNQVTTGSPNQTSYNNPQSNDSTNGGTSGYLQNSSATGARPSGPPQRTAGDTTGSRPPMNYGPPSEANTLPRPPGAFPNSRMNTAADLRSGSDPSQGFGSNDAHGANPSAIRGPPGSGPQSPSYRSQGAPPGASDSAPGPRSASQGLPGAQTNGASGPQSYNMRSSGQGPPSGPVGGLPSQQSRGFGAPRAPSQGPNPQKVNLPPLKPVFGKSLNDLFQRDNSAVPTIVYQCVQAIDLFGLDTEGIYRTSGSAPHIMELKAQFDHGEQSLILQSNNY